MPTSEQDKILDRINKTNIAEYEYHRHRFSNDVKDFVNKLMSTKYKKYQSYCKEDFIKHMIEEIKSYYFIK